MALDRDRYHELLGCLLDGEISDAQAEELTQMLTSQPGWRRDFQEHLVLWDLWSQLTTPERSAAAFAAAWRTRLAAEAGAVEFREAVRTKLEAAAPRQERRGLREVINASLGTWKMALHRPAGLAWAATMTLAAVVAGLLWVTLPHSAHATVTIHGEAVCTACVLHQTHECHPAIRVTAGGATQIYYLDSNRAVAGLQGRFCTGPTPAVATGTTATKGGRLLFDAASVVLPEDRKNRDPPKKDERVLFPF
jgi:hypothetical protein